MKLRSLTAMPLEATYAAIFGGEGQVPLQQVAKKVKKLKKSLTKQEVQAVNKRLSAIGQRLPIPKGIDPYKARPDRKAARGR